VTASAATACPACGRGARQDARFCDACGSQIAHGEDASYCDYRDRYRAIAKSLGFEGQIKWAEAMP
jgi:predicted amidophosphoribosyltransferase